MQKQVTLLSSKKDFLTKVRATNTTHKKIVMGITDLSFHRVTGALVTYILEEMGYEVQRKYALHEENFRRLKDEEIDMISSAWLPSSHGVYKKEVEKKIEVIELGLHYTPYALWGVPDYIPHTYKIRDLKDPEGLLGIVDRAVLLVNKKKIEKTFTPEQIEILDEIVLSNEIISELDYMVNREGLSNDEAVRKWFHQDIK